MEYKIKTSKEFDEDLTSTYTYLLKKFKSAQAVRNLRLSIKKSIQNLHSIPEAFSKLDLGSRNTYRFINCNNYMIIYSVEGNDVVLQRFLYSKSDIKSRFKDNLNE